MNHHIKSARSTVLCLLGELLFVAHLLAFTGTASAYFTTYKFVYGDFGDTAAPADINDHGVIVWTGFGDSYVHGASWVNGDFVNGYGDASGCVVCGVQVYDINNAGDLLGLGFKNGVYVPTIWLAGVPYDLTDPANAGLIFHFDPGPQSVNNFDLTKLDVKDLPDFFDTFPSDFISTFALTNARGDFVFAYPNGWGGLDSSYGILIAQVPEPTTLVLLGLGLVGFAVTRRRKLN